MSPLVIDGVSEWEPDHLHLAEAYYARFTRWPGGTGGWFKQYDSVRQFDNAGPNRPWTYMQPLLGATIGPNRGAGYYLALGFQATGAAPTGEIRGIILTYHTLGGKVYRLRVPTQVSFCSGEENAASCIALHRQMRARDVLDDHLHDPSERELNEAGTWNGD